MQTDPIIHPHYSTIHISTPKDFKTPRRSKRKDNEVPHPSGPTTNVVDEAVNEEMDDSLVMATTTASSLEAEQDSGNTLQSGEDSLKLNELMELCTNLQTRVLDLETTKTTQANEIASLKRRVKISTVTASTKDSVATTTTAIIPTPRKGIDKGKEKMVEPEKPMKKKLIRLDEEIASKLQAEFDEEVRLAREKAKKEQEANVALTEEWDDIQAKIEVDHELAQRLQAQEQEELSNVEKAILFVQLLEKRRNHFVVKRAEEKRNKPPTQAQQRKKYFKESRSQLEQESSKKQKVDDDKETTQLKSLMEVIPDEEEVALDAIPLAVKPPSIVDWKIYKERQEKAITSNLG
ncbi:hypothetical protein Tco_0752192 [Tanacetum coccineum]|uniref:Uncharacterized protein n=1 Tax=Tanacetum coccineum TaxID=301880 RepID=A0ABQ4Z8S2_9ASTR